MMTPAYFQTLARYNTWANRWLYEAAAELDDAAWRRARPAAYFTSLQGTLNHLLVGDRETIVGDHHRPRLLEGCEVAELLTAQAAAQRRRRSQPRLA